MQVPTKSIFKSKTFWTAAAVALLGVLQVVSGFLTEIGIEGQVIAIIGFVMMVLRAITGQPVSLSGEGSKEISVD